MEREFNFTENNFKFIISLVNEKTGIVLAEHKKDMVYSRLARRLRALNLNDFEDYCKIIKNNENDEMENFVNSITTNLTSFFREKHHFDHLAETIKTIAKNKNRLRIWSAGCSMGMEAYSIAVTIYENLAGAKNKDIKILATDIDTNVLETGTKAVYSAEQIKNIPTKYHKYFDITEDEMAVRADIKKLVSFKKLNLLENWPVKGPFDIIFCRNTVIYFDKETQKNIFEKFYKLLTPESFLYIGHSENLYKITDLYTSIGKTIYQRVS